MKVVLILLVLATLVAGIPSYQSYVTDQARIFSPSEKMELEQVLIQIEKNTTAEIAIVTVPSLEGMSIEEYSIQLAEQWKVGKKDTDNGLIILIAPNERAYRIEVGYGLEGTLPDSLVGRLGREILVPAFKEEKYGLGVLELIKALQAHLEDPSIISRHSDTFNMVIMWLIVLVLILTFGLIFYYSLTQRYQTELKNSKQDNSRRGRGGIGGFFGGSGGGSGGFGGFGGGGFGGGGGGGRW